MKIIINHLVLLILLIISNLLAEVPNEINYQGRLRESDVGVSGNRTFKFNIYDAETSGNLLWTSNDQVIFVSSGTFNYVLTPTVDWKKKDLWIETLVGGSILLPRQKIVANAYSLHSDTSEGLNNSNGSFIINESSASFSIGSYTTTLDIENSQLKCLSDSTTFYMIPKGGIIMWSGDPGNLPAGWVLCDGTNSTPDLRGRFVVGYYATGDAGGDYSSIGSGETVDAGNTSGNRSPGGQKTHTLTTNEMPQHNHSTSGGNYVVDGPGTVFTPGMGGGIASATDNTGSSEAHENRPPYYVIAYIMKM